MRTNPAPFFFCLAMLVAVCFESEAEADDSYASVTLVPGADGGTTASTSSLPVSGEQLMIRCGTYSGVTVKFCDYGVTCTAGANDSPVDADKSIDLCPKTSRRQVSVYKAYDGGNPSCRFYNVNPKTVCPQ